MEHLSLEIFNLSGTDSKYASLPEDTTITIIDTSDIFGSGDVWSYNFSLNVEANAHIFGSAGDIHGSRLHEQINKRRARLWVEGLPLYLGYLRLDDEAEVDRDGNVDVRFESGQKTFDEMIEGTNAREVSVGDVVIGVALNRKRIIETISPGYRFKLDGLEPYAVKDSRLRTVCESFFDKNIDGANKYKYTPYSQRWPKLVKSHGKVWDSYGTERNLDFTNIQSPYDAGHTFCNINICYPLKVNDNGEEKAARGYTMRLAHGDPTTHGGDNQTRYNNAPNFYLLHFINRLFKDLKIYVEENQAMNVEDLRRVFMLNYGCYYEEIENRGDYFDSTAHRTPESMLGRYGQYYMPFLDKDGEKYITNSWMNAGDRADPENGFGNASAGKVLLRDVVVQIGGETVLQVGSIEGKVYSSWFNKEGAFGDYDRADFHPAPYLYSEEKTLGAYSAYLAYATGDNYPKVEIKEIIEAMKAMFGVRFLFSDDYKRVRIVLLRNIFRNTDVQRINCEITDDDVKLENGIRGFRMTYGKGEEDTSFYYKGFNDLFPRVSKTWKDTSDTHDYSQWKLDASYDEIKQHVSAMNKICYVTPVNGNAYGVKVDEEEDVLYPSLFEMAGFMDAEDGDCSRTEDEGETIEEVQINASPVIMNDVNDTYASLFNGDMKAPTTIKADDNEGDDGAYNNSATKIATFARITTESVDFNQGGIDPEDGHARTGFTVSGKLDVYSCEGFRIRMEDNYGISNGGTPFDEADPGLCFGIMRSSGADAHIFYDKDEIENERPMNDYWEVVPGSGAIDHPDTCNSYGNEWDYDGSFTITPAQAPAKLAEMFPNSDAPFNDPVLGYITGTMWIYIRDNSGRSTKVLLATEYSEAGVTVTGSGDIRYFATLTLEELQELSHNSRHMIVEVDSSDERGSTLVQLCKLAYGGGTEPITIDNGVGSRYGRFSLKLRAEKLNPYFDPSAAESSYNRRYLAITNENLRKRGLCDQFYKEYSYWVRNARILKRNVNMELAQLLAIDKTKRVEVGDVIGFIKKMQIPVNNKTGLGMVSMEIMYI